MFDTQTSFNDSIFYDVSAWTFPLAFNVNYSMTNGLNRSTVERIKSSEVDILENNSGSVDGKSDYAYIFEPH